MKLLRQNVVKPVTTRATPSVEFIVLQGHSGYNHNFLSALHPAIWARIWFWKALIHACLLRADVRSYGVRLRFQFLRPSCLTVEMIPVLQQSLRDFAGGIRHG
jgi:hypothetical protein